MGLVRLAFELEQRGISPVPSLATLYRVLARNTLIVPARRRPRSSCIRWEREAPMVLWQLDVMGGVFLADGTELKLVSGVDDHSRYCVIAALVIRATGRAVCSAFAAALRQFGAPEEVLTDNGKQFTGRFTRPRPSEVLFERICRENAITTRPPAAAPGLPLRLRLRPKLRVGHAHRGKVVTVAIDDTQFRIIHDGTQLSAHPRTVSKEVTRRSASGHPGYQT